MMYQFFQQAEKWHLRLHADISEMQNKYNLFIYFYYYFNNFISMDKNIIVDFIENCYKRWKKLNLIMT